MNSPAEYPAAKSSPKRIPFSSTTVTSGAAASPASSTGAARSSFCRGRCLPKTRAAAKPCRADHAASPSSAVSRASSSLWEMSTSLPKRSTQPPGVVSSRWAFVPAAAKPASAALLSQAVGGFCECGDRAGWFMEWPRELIATPVWFK